MVGNNLLYALYKDVNLISIDEAERGIACNCFCPSCHSQLVARKGNVRIPHFAHYKNNSCATGYQTSLHLLAKELVCEKKKIIIPPVPCLIFHEDENEEEGYFFRSEVIKDEQRLSDVDVYLETKENGIIPDIIIQYGDYKLYVEIYVTHKVDDDKKQLVKEKDIAMMEIDLSKEDRMISKEELSKYLFEDTCKSSWINNRILNKRNAEEQKKKDDFLKKRELEKQKKQQEEERERERIFAERKKQQEEEIKRGICPNCHKPFVKVWDKQSHTSFIACYKFCDFCSSLSDENKKIIQKVLKDKPIINKSIWAFQYGKCPKCWSNLLIRNGPHGPFIGCAKYPHCEAKITIDEETKLYLPVELTDKLKEKRREYYKKSSKKPTTPANEDDDSIEAFLASYGSDK